MRVKAIIKFKEKYGLIYIGRISKNGIFHFRNIQLRKACLNQLKETFKYDCPGGSLTISDINKKTTKDMFKIDKYITCFSCVIPEKENNKYIVTYWNEKFKI
jgi:hypothetical protein